MPSKHVFRVQFPVGVFFDDTICSWLSNPGIVIRGCSSNGRAPALQAGSSGIDTRQLHLFTIVNNRGVVAQMVERSLSMRDVAGSIPANSINLL